MESNSGTKEAYINLWKTRKQLANTILDSLSEGTGLTKATLIEKIGISTDEDLGVDLKSLIKTHHRRHRPAITTITSPASVTTTPKIPKWPMSTPRESVNQSMSMNCTQKYPKRRRRKRISRYVKKAERIKIYRIKHYNKLRFKIVKSEEDSSLTMRMTRHPPSPYEIVQLIHAPLKSSMEEIIRAASHSHSTSHPAPPEIGNGFKSGGEMSFGVFVSQSVAANGGNQLNKEQFEGNICVVARPLVLPADPDPEPKDMVVSESDSEMSDCSSNNNTDAVSKYFKVELNNSSSMSVAVN